MPSTNQTAHLSLSQYLGSDKPKMADFNENYLKIDNFCKQHSENQVAHVTQADRSRWDQPYEITSYVGDDTTPKTLTLEKTPKIGFVFPVSELPIECSTSPSVQNYTRLGFFSSLGCTFGITLANKTLTLKSFPSSITGGKNAKFNVSGVTYVVVYFPEEA